MKVSNFKKNQSLEICYDLVVENQNKVTQSESEVYEIEQLIIDSYLETKKDLIPEPLHQEYQTAYQKLQENKRQLEWSNFHLQYLEKLLYKISPNMKGFKEKYSQYQELKKMVI